MTQALLAILIGVVVVDSLITWLYCEGLYRKFEDLQRDRLMERLRG